MLQKNASLVLIVLHTKLDTWISKCIKIFFEKDSQDLISTDMYVITQEFRNWKFYWN